MAATIGGYAVMTHREPSPHSPSSCSSSAASLMDGQDSSNEYIWTPPAIDPNYWIHITKARSMRTGILSQKRALEKAYERAEANGDRIAVLKTDIVGREKRLLRYINHYILDYDDVLSVRSRHSVLLGALSPPLSPELQPAKSLKNLPLAPLNVTLLTEEPPNFASGSLPPTPTTRGDSGESFGNPREATEPAKRVSHIPRPVSKDADAAGGMAVTARVRFAGVGDNKPTLDSQSFINSYRANARYAAAAAAASPPPTTATTKTSAAAAATAAAAGTMVDAARTKNLPGVPQDTENKVKEQPRTKTKGRLMWAGLFGSKNVRPTTTADIGEQRPAILSKTQSEREEIRINPRLHTRSSEPALGHSTKPNNHRGFTNVAIQLL
ncbi:hypothetical protein H4217_001671 [Coemansia sp. RSA 1939]|nr:hypothetical protein H4217_001671 [Coemansia sp. RSA 1939]KAJ2615084.1 hypothetical protein EV177_001747 [Coemansia sp. RSA 1804]